MYKFSRYWSSNKIEYRIEKHILYIKEVFLIYFSQD